MNTQQERVGKLSQVTKAHLPGIFTEDGAAMHDNAEETENRNPRSAKK